MRCSIQPVTPSQAPRCRSRSRPIWRMRHRPLEQRPADRYALSGRRAGWPVTVQARQARADGRPTLLTVYLDPPTGRVLDVVDFRSSLFGFLHRFHENLTVPAILRPRHRRMGRRRNAASRVDRHLAVVAAQRRVPARSALEPSAGHDHQSASSARLLDFAAAGVVSLTGIYLSFPQTARTAMQSVLPMGPSQRGAFGGAGRGNARA